MRKKTLTTISVLLVLLTVASAIASTEYLDAFSTTEQTTEQRQSPDQNLGTGTAVSSTFKTSKSGSLFTVEASISNPSNGRPIDGIIELQARKKGAFLSFAQNEKSCNLDHPWNVNGNLKLNPGETQTIKLTSDISKAGDGVYDFYLVSVDQCCVFTACSAIAPYGWETLVSTGVAFGSGQVTKVECSYDFDCDHKLNVDGGAKCINPMTKDAYCQLTNKTDPGANSYANYAIASGVGIVALLGFLLWRKL